MHDKIGITGAGVMGRGVAHRFAAYGYQVTLIDVCQDKVMQAQNEIFKQLKVSKMFNPDINIEEIMSRINISATYQSLQDSDYIVENVTENIGVKQGVYRELDDICNDNCIFLSDTSCIPITLIGSFTKRADKIIGVHFMNPVPSKNFAEVIKGTITSNETIEKVKELLNSIGLTIEIINDSAGFVSNRLSHLFMNEAAFLIYEGVADAKQIDNIFKKAFGHKMGPLETADLIGIDTVVDSLKVLYDYYEDSKFRVCPLLKKKVYSGELGRKTNVGFYKY